jgi:predicted Rossmann fold nucleotide-binding protein DprA/Smf involved in DNA uptake
MWHSPLVALSQHNVGTGSLQAHGSDRALAAFALTRLPGARLAALSAALRRSEARFPLDEPVLRDAGVRPADTGQAVLDDARQLLEAHLPNGGVLLCIGDEAYPRGLLARLGDEAPPVLVCVGELSLLRLPKVALVNSHRKQAVRSEDRWVHATLRLAEACAEHGFVQVGSRDRPHYDLSTFKAELDAAPRIIVLEDATASVEVPPSGGRSLILTAVLPGQTPPASRDRLQLRDRLVVNLADLTIAVDVRKDGVVHEACRVRLAQDGGVAAVRHGDHDAACGATDDLIRQGAAQLAADRAGRTLSLLVKQSRGEEIPRPVSGEADAGRRADLGQFFTSRAIADLAWQGLGLLWHREHNKELPRHARVIDPAAGEGVFLESALAHGIAPDGLVGTDIDEMLVPTWRERFAAHPFAAPLLMNGLENDELLAISPGAFDFVVGNPPFAGRGLRDLESLLASAAVQPQLGLFEKAVEATPDTAALRRRARLAELARSVAADFVTWQATSSADPEDDAGVTRDCSAQGALWDSPSARRGSLRAVVNGYHHASLRFHSATTLTADEREAVRRLVGFPIEILFAERFVQLLKPRGYGAVVLPEALLAKAKARSFREWFLLHAIPKAIIGLPSPAFKEVGAKVTTALVLFQKRQKPVSAGSVLDDASDVPMMFPDEPFPAGGLDEYLKSASGFLRERLSQAESP